MADSSHPAVRTGPPTTWSTVVALSLVQFVDVMSVTVTVTALPQMLADVGAASSDGTLVATGYAMFFGGLLMFGARLGDRIGHRRCILSSLVVFAAGALLAATATSTLILTAARCLQGAGAAVAVPSALKLLTSVTGSETARARAIAVWSASGAAAGASGFVVGGVIADVGNWRMVFWGLLIVATGLAVTITALVPPDSRSHRSHRLNLAASALLTAAVMLVVVGATLLGRPHHHAAAAAMLGGAAVASVFFVVVDRRSTSPLLPRALVGRPQVRRGAVGAFFNTATTAGAATLLTLYLQDALGKSPLEAAATLVPFSVLVIAGSAAAARLSGRMTHEHIAATGLGLIGGGIATPLLSPASLIVVGSGMAVAGLGIGLSSVATTSMATDVPEKQRAAAGGIVNTSAQLGTAIGTAALLLVAAVTTGAPSSTAGPPSIAWALAAALAGTAALSFMRFRAA